MTPGSGFKYWFSILADILAASMTIMIHILLHKHMVRLSVITDCITGYSVRKILDYKKEFQLSARGVLA